MIEAPATTRRRVRRFVPRQHGAWAMLLVPVLAGIIVAGADWTELPLLGALLAGYSLSYFALQAFKTRRVRRYRDQLMLYATIATLLAVPVVLARPQVLLLAPAWALLIGVNVRYAVRRRERAVANDLVSVVLSSLMIFAIAAVAGAPMRTVVPAFVVVTAYLAGTVFFVKTMIRERGNLGYRRLSVGYHLAALTVVAWYGPWLAGLFAWFLVRAWLLPGRRVPAARVGLLEVGNSLLLLLTIALMDHP